MDIGMLWFDNDAQAGLTGRVKRAAEYYRNKYGQAPNVCFVHPSMLPDEEDGLKVAGVEIRASNALLPNHFWVGVERKPVQAVSAATSVSRATSAST